MPGRDDAADDFAVAVTFGPTGALEVLVVGELDLDTSPELVRTVLDEVTRTPADVAIVLNGVSFVDSTGMVALLDIRDALVAGGRSLLLVAPSAAVRYVLELSGLTDEFSIEA